MSELNKLLKELDTLLSSDSSPEHDALLRVCVEQLHRTLDRLRHEDVGSGDWFVGVSNQTRFCVLHAFTAFTMVELAARREINKGVVPKPDPSRN